MYWMDKHFIISEQRQYYENTPVVTKTDSIWKLKSNFRRLVTKIAYFYCDFTTWNLHRPFDVNTFEYKNVVFCVPQNKENHTDLGEKCEGETMNFLF